VQPTIVKNLLKTPILGAQDRSMWSMLINLKKPVTSACYDNQHVCTYMQPFSRYTSQQWQNNVFLGGAPLWRPCSRGIPLPKDTKICHDKLVSLGHPLVKISWF